MLTYFTSFFGPILLADRIRMKRDTPMQCLLKRWQLWLVGALGVAFLLCVGVFDWRHRPTMEECYRIDRGMTPAQVEAILGAPHKVLTSETDEATLDLGQLGFKPDHDDP